MIVLVCGSKSINESRCKCSYGLSVRVHDSSTKHLCKDKRFNRANDLMVHLKKRYAPSKKYQWCFGSIVNLRMKQTETVSDY